MSGRRGSDSGAAQISSWGLNAMTDRCVRRASSEVIFIGVGIVFLPGRKMGLIEKIRDTTRNFLHQAHEYPRTEDDRLTMLPSSPTHIHSGVRQNRTGDEPQFSSVCRCRLYCFPRNRGWPSAGIPVRDYCGGAQYYSHEPVPTGADGDAFRSWDHEIQILACSHGSRRHEKAQLELRRHSPLAPAGIVLAMRTINSRT